MSWGRRRGTSSGRPGDQYLPAGYHVALWKCCTTYVPLFNVSLFDLAVFNVALCTVVLFKVALF